MEWLAGLREDKKKVVHDHRCVKPRLYSAVRIRPSQRNRLTQATWSRVWDERFEKGYLAGENEPAQLQSYGPIHLAPIRTRALLALERFISLEEIDVQPLALVVGDACSGRSVLLARLLAQRMNQRPAVPGLSVSALSQQLLMPRDSKTKKGLTALVRGRYRSKARRGW